MVMVGDLLATTDVELRPLHLPRPHAEVRWVATSELTDPAPFLEGGEVLLTTGLAMASAGADAGAGADARVGAGAGRRGEWPAYVERLAAAGVVAIGFGVELTHRSVPGSLVAACRRQAMNLFEVPKPTTFVAISRAAARLIEADRGRAARAALDVQRELTRAAVRDDGPAALLARLGAAAGGAACTMAGDGTLDLAPAGPRPELLGQAIAIVRAEIARMRPQGLRAAASVSTRDATLLVYPIGLRDRSFGYLAVACPGRANAVQRGAAVTAVALLGLVAARGRAGRDIERGLRVRAIELLLRGDERTAGLVLAAGLGPDAGLPDRAAVVRAAAGVDGAGVEGAGVDGVGAAAGGADAGGAETGGADDRLADALAAVEPRHRLSGLVDGQLVIIARPEETSALAGRLAAAHALRVGVGDVVGPAELGRSGETAAHALAGTTAAAPVAYWGDIVHQGPLSLIDPARATAFAESFLAPLGDDQGLRATLRSFLRHHGSHARVAEELGVHRNTVRHRIGAIETAIGGSLHDPQVRFAAWVALQARPRAISQT